MKNAQPLYDSATRYRIALHGKVDVAWLESFDSSMEIIVDDVRQADGQMEEITVIGVQTDQSGIVGLVRKLHGLGMTILQLQVIR